MYLCKSVPTTVVTMMKKKYLMYKNNNFLSVVQVVFVCVYSYRHGEYGGLRHQGGHGPQQAALRRNCQFNSLMTHQAPLTVPTQSQPARPLSDIARSLHPYVPPVDLNSLSKFRKTK
ncbi:unnamed protein product [Leptidea sinapis]|uniref:Uncharacterized protein n=1 Tax=Leptidea sinapis TaxID=189913 RepID=A0A5E4R2A2_9NEOP|nr:unnamed protein product [Leptidea sinapis]